MPTTITTCFIILIGLIILLITEAKSRDLRSRSLEDVLSGRGSMHVLINKHLMNLVVLSAACFVFFFLQDDVDLWHLPEGYYMWTIVWMSSLVLVFVTGIAGAREKLYGLYKLTPIFIPSTNLIKLYFITRALFLIAYELFFRGIILGTAMQLFNTSWAILINIILYVIAHLFSNKKEMIGAVPFGFVLCLLSIHLQSVWPAISLHLVLSFTYEIKIIRYLSHSTQKINI